MKKPKLILKIVLMSVISLLLVTSIILSTILGSVNAKLFKSFLKNIDFEVLPDLSFSYYLNDANNKNGITGVYKNTSSITQNVKTLPETVKTLYRIAIPVDESGYYTLKFTVNIIRSDATEYYVRNLDAPVGCQVFSPDYIDFDSTEIYSMSPDGSVDYGPNGTADDGYVYGTKISHGDKQLFEAKNHYQWKTLAPYRTETVELSFNVEQTDVDNYGYVVWAWDLTGLNANKEYTFNLKDISIKKNTPNDYAKPYFEFMNTQYVNNAILPTKDHSKSASPYSGVGVTASGLTRHNRARGTFVTNGTYDSLTMQASPLYMGYNGTKKFLTANITDNQSQKSNYENVISFSAPIKNIKPNTNYRVSFDFSVANQGTGTTSYEDIVNKDNNTTPNGSAAYANYQSGYRNFFNNNEAWNTLHFQSYIGKGATSGTSISAHTTGRGTVRFANVGFPGHEVTRYDEIFYVGGDETETVAGKTYEISDSRYTSASVTEDKSHAVALNSGITDLAGDEFNSGKGINWLNAIKHTEEEGDYLIHWLTFYNTSFTFNVDHDYAGKEVTLANGYCQNLFWTWAIDALEQAKYFRIKIENVRIEEVEQYGSCLTEKSLKIGGEENGRIDFFAGNFTTKNINGKTVSNTYRCANGTGQNYQARGYITKDSLPRLAGNNIFGAIYDAGDIDINGNYEIKFNGYCAVKGGVEKYVWSADGGATWYDMKADTLRAPSSTSSGEQDRISIHCENLVDQRFNNTSKLSFLGETKCDPYETKINEETTIYNHYSKPGEVDTVEDEQPFDFIDFVKGTDDINSVFLGLTADLSKYKYQRDLDIVFAAVPIQNPTARCEILRIINFNSSKQYRTFTLECESDFEIAYNNTKLNAVNDTSNSESKIKFTQTYGYKYNKNGTTITKAVASTGGYSWRTEVSNAYEDIRTLYSNVPIKNILTIRGWAIVEGGVEAYMWSVDKGKNWNTCEQRGTSTSSANTDLDTQYTSWYSPDGSGSLSDDLKKGAYFDGANNGLIIDLTDYVGKVVDLIVVAKPTGSDALCPVSRIDNVAVYGAGEKDRGMGLFYSEISYLAIGSSVITNQVTTYPDGVTALNGGSQWNIGLNSEALTVYEPYNVDVLSTRLYNQDVHNISNGGTVTIGGAIACNRGVAKYKYSIDGGAWKEFSGSVVNCDSGSSFVETVQKTTDKSFTVADTADYSKTMLSLTLPTNISGEKDLIVVAEGNNGYLYPILHVKLNIAKAN